MHIPVSTTKFGCFCENAHTSIASTMTLASFYVGRIWSNVPWRWSNRLLFSQSYNETQSTTAVIFWCYVLRYYYDRRQTRNKRHFYTDIQQSRLVTFDSVYQSVTVSMVTSMHGCCWFRGVSPKGVGRAISHIFKSGRLTDWSFWVIYF